MNIYKFYKVDNVGNSVFVNDILVGDITDLELKKLVRRILKLGRLSLSKLYISYYYDNMFDEVDKIVVWKEVKRGHYYVQKKVGVGIKA